MPETDYSLVFAPERTIEGNALEELVSNPQLIGPYSAKCKKIAKNVTAMVVPGSGLVKQQAEDEGLDKIFTNAGFQWREPGCSMCLAMNDDKLASKERCASTSNRNFEGRQGRGGRTHLVSPVSYTHLTLPTNREV